MGDTSEIRVHSDTSANSDTSASESKSFQLSDLEQIGEQIPGGFFIYRADDSQEMLYVNQQVLRIFGCDTLEQFKELTGYTFRGLVHPDDFLKIQQSIDEQIADRSNQDLDYVVYRIIRRDGEIRYIDDYGHFAHLPGYGDVYYVFIGDITDSRLAQEENFRMELELERERRANEIKSSFLINISHDIRIPMETILEYSDQARYHVRQPDLLREDLHKLNAAGQQLSSQIDNLLDLSSVEYGRMELKTAACDLTALIQGVLHLFQPQATKKDIHLVEDLHLPPDEVLLDEQSFRTVLSNLLSNAIRFTGIGGTVTLTAQHRQLWQNGFAHMEFVITDTGVGMSETYLQQVLDSLEAQSDATHAGMIGEGRGLAISKKLLSMMGASLHIRSTEGRGTTVTVTLPVKLASHNRRVQFDSLFDLGALMAGDRYLFLFDADNAFLRMSPTLASALGLPETMNTEGLPMFLAYIHPDDRDLFMDTLSDILEMRRHAFRLTLRVRTADNLFLTAQLMGASTRNLDGTLDFLGGTLTFTDPALYTDPITGLPPYDQLIQKLDRDSAEGHTQGSILFLHIYPMGRINEAFGYSYGNTVLQLAGQYMVSILGSRGQVYRMNGASFALWLNNNLESAIQELYTRIQAQLYQGLEIDGLCHRLLCCGAATVLPASVHERALYHMLTNACQESRRKQQGALVLCHSRSDGLELTYGLIAAVLQSMNGICQDFYLLYQPVFSPSRDPIPQGAEVLLRWKNEAFGVVAPRVFLPEVEKEDTFARLGWWILRRAMADGQLFISHREDFFISLNVSPIQIGDRNFATQLVELAESTSFPLDHLMLELNQACRTLPLDLLQYAMQILHRHGVRFGLDDYGVGDMWLELLRALPFDYVKISNECILALTESQAQAQIQEQESLRALVQLAQARGVQVYAKAVEHAQTADFLSTLPVAGMQGNYLGAPIYFDEILERLESPAQV